jgi:hypothetical protein
MFRAVLPIGAKQLCRYRNLEGLGVQLAHDVFARSNEPIANKNELGRRAILWWAHAVFAMTFAGVLAASPFWVGLPLQRAEILASIIFPAMIVAYIIARGSCKNPLTLARRGWLSSCQMERLLTGM